MQHIPNLPRSGNCLKFAKITLQLTWIFFSTSFLTDSKSFVSEICIYCHNSSSLSLFDAVYEKAELSVHLETSRLFYNKNSLTCLLLSLLLRSHYGALSTVLLVQASILQCFLERLMFPKESMIFWQTLRLSLYKSRWHLSNNAFVQME